MARGRKQQYISVLTSKDQNMLRAFRAIGILNEQHLKTHLKQSERRIENFIRDGYVARGVVDNKKTGKPEYAYKLTEKGQEVARSQLNLTNFYSSHSPRHDYALAEQYFKATEVQQKNWLTEADWKDRFNEMIEQLRDRGEEVRAEQLEQQYEMRGFSLPDGGWCESGDGDAVVAVEIITNNYSEVEIQAKQAFVEAVNAEYKPINI